MSTTPAPVCASTAGWSTEVTTDESVHRGRRHLQRLLRLPVRLQGRARRQRLGPHRQAAARLRPVLDARGRAHLRPGAAGAHALRRQPLQPLRRGALHGLVQGRGRDVQARRRPRASSTPTGAPAAGAAWTPARTTRSTSTRTSTSRRSAPAARTCWTAAGRPRAAWTPAPPAPSSSARRASSPSSSPRRRSRSRSSAPGRACTTCNVPKKFIAGTVYDPVEKEVVIGATVTATAADGASCSAQTDAFGDFWLRGLDEGTYAVTITADGFAPATCEVSTRARREPRRHPPCAIGGGPPRRPT